MSDVRIYGDEKKIEVAVIHGGPGAPGYMAPVARELSKNIGVIEPIQSKGTLSGQLDELNTQIMKHTSKPIILIGSSWGATLALLYTAKFPTLVSKIILIGSCVYDSNSSAKIKEIRLGGMSNSTRSEFNKMGLEIESLSGKERDSIFSKMADCLLESDCFDPITNDLEIIDYQYSINKSVWSDFKKIRDNLAELKTIFSKVKIPVVNIHGEHDPHIIEGIQPFLESCIEDVSLKVLEKCGHYPWIEKSAKDAFYKVVSNEINNNERLNKN